MQFCPYLSYNVNKHRRSHMPAASSKTKISPDCSRGSRSVFHFGQNVEAISQYLYFYGSFNLQKVDICS